MIRESHRCRFVLGTALALALKAAPLLAQFPATVTPGSRVRIAIPDTVRQLPLGPHNQFIYATVAANTADTLYLSIPNTQGSLAVPHANVKAMAISNGLPTRRRSILVNGLRWAAIGAAEFYMIHVLGGADSFDSERGAALGGAGVGFTLGAILGARRPVEQWRDVPLRSTARVP
jgi:hypothetical protein